MKSLLDLWRVMASELAIWCETSTTADFNTVSSRVEDEGISFLTITLSDFGKEFERALERGHVVSSDFSAFKHRRKWLPAFLQGFTRQVFDWRSGQILRDPNIDCIFAIRQLTAVFAKIELPCSTTRTIRAMQDYVECEMEVETREEGISTPPDYIQRFMEVSRFLYGRLFYNMDLDIHADELLPRHGPGATADGLSGNGKYVQREWTTRLEAVFPYGEYCIPNWRYYYLLDGVNFLEPGAERPVRVVPVPKTLRKPRIIAIEPTCMQYMQQAVARPMMRELESPRWPGNGLIGFTDQLPNREMAREGSRVGHLATIDLSEASDRVPYWLVQLMLSFNPLLQEAVDATRSTRAEIPELGLCLPNLRKFASMGSALCFPIEAMVFLTIALMGVIDPVKGIDWTEPLPLHEGTLKSLRGEVRVYGDDIIVPVDNAASVIHYLEAFGLKVNHGKTFRNGKFRESCGGDYYDGEDVTPIRLRREIPSSRSDVLKCATLVEFRNNLYLRGLWKTASFLDNIIEGLLGGYFPIVEETAPCMGRRSFLPYEAERFDEHTHSPMVRAWVLRPIIPGNSVSDEWALLKCLTSPVMQEDAKHLERSGRPAYVATNLRWVRPF